MVGPDTCSVGGRSQAINARIGPSTSAGHCQNAVGGLGDDEGSPAAPPTPVRRPRGAEPITRVGNICSTRTADQKLENIPGVQLKAATDDRSNPPVISGIPTRLFVPSALGSVSHDVVVSRVGNRPLYDGSAEVEGVGCLGMQG